MNNLRLPYHPMPRNFSKSQPHFSLFIPAPRIALSIPRYSQRPISETCLSLMHKISFLSTQVDTKSSVTGQRQVVHATSQESKPESILPCQYSTGRKQYLVTMITTLFTKCEANQTHLRWNSNLLSYALPTLNDRI